MNKVFFLVLVVLIGCSHKDEPKAPAMQVGALFKDCDVCPEMVLLPGGSFVMGAPKDEVGYQPDESPQRTVTIRQSFAIGIYEVMADEWEAFVQETGAPRRSGDTRPGRACTEGKPSYPQAGRQPAVCLSYDDAGNYVKWLAEKTGKRYRLPSEAEWEYAARAGSTGPFPFPFDEEGVYRINKHANTYGDADGFVYTSPAGSFPPNGFGVFDMHGNVHEWVEDCLHHDYVDAPTDGGAWIKSGSCDRRHIRGNDWIEPPIYSRSANRNSRPTETFGDWLGVRVVRDL